MMLFLNYAGHSVCCHLFLLDNFKLHNLAVAQQPINKNENDNGSKTATAQFFGTVAGYNCSKPILHIVFYGVKDKNYATLPHACKYHLQERQPKILP